MTIDKQTEQQKGRLLACFPIWAPVNSDPADDSYDDIFNRQHKFLMLDESIKDKLSDIEIAKKIESIGNHFNLETNQLYSIARSILYFYFKEIEKGDFVRIFIQEMNIDPETAQKITGEIFDKIINDDSFEKKYQANIDSLPIRDALKKYPEIGNQILSQKKILLKDFHSEAHPTVENWLKDYTALLGFREHDAIERGNYLFHSMNAKNLSSGEREKLAQLLKSFDENIPLRINKQSKQILFSSTPKTTLQKKASSSKPTQENNIQKTAFNFHQKMPFEKNQETKSDKKRLPSPEEMLLSTGNVKKTGQANQRNSKNIIDLKNLN